MKSMEIKNHKDAEINDGWKSLWGQWWKLFHFWPAPLQAFALVMSPRLGL
jgi:hypothetical protein